MKEITYDRWQEKIQINFYNFSNLKSAIDFIYANSLKDELSFSYKIQTEPSFAIILADVRYFHINVWFADRWGRSYACQ